MNLDMWRLAVVYFPLTFLVLSFVLGFFARDVLNMIRALVRGSRKSAQ